MRFLLIRVHLRLSAANFLLALFLCASAFALDITTLQRTAYVDDFAHVIDAASAKSLEAYCEGLEVSTGVQVTIVTLETLGGDDISGVANKLFRQWRLGTKPQDNGLLLLFAIKDNQDRAEVGYGLEPVITDADAGSILRGIRPILRQGTYGPALLAAVQQFGAKIQLSPDARTAAHRAQSIPYWVVAPALFLLLSLIFWITNGRRGGVKGIFTALFDNMGGRRKAWAGGAFGDPSGAAGSSGSFGSSGGSDGGSSCGGDSGGGGASSNW